MSGKPVLFLVDVFAEKAYAGNQLAVVVGADPSEWPTERMQAFAHEMNFSETTFAGAAPRDGAYDYRIFTPADEMPFAGHPTLGTAWVLGRHLGAADSEGRITLRAAIGPVPVDFVQTEFGELVRMRPRSPDLKGILEAGVVAAHLGLPTSAIDERYPCRHVGIGIDFVIAPLRDLDALRAAKPKTFPTGDDGRPIFILPFAPEPYEGDADLSARMFFEAYGVREDPATGSACACLAAWLSQERYFGSAKVRARVQQGYEVARPSCLYIAAEPKDGGFAVEVAGKVRLVASGNVA